jgi:hypothetical protein
VLRRRRRWRWRERLVLVAALDAERCRRAREWWGKMTLSPINTL